MSCYWYDSDYSLSTCTYDVGDVLHTCDCGGDIDSCTLRECGARVAFEKSMPEAPKRDFSISHITDCIIYDIIALSEAGSDYKKVSVEVAKELLNRYEKEV